MAKSKQAMLEAGVRLYRCQSSDLLKGLAVGAVADTAGFHRQTFYRYWDTQAEYVQDLVRWLMDPRRRPGPDGGTQPPGPREVPADIEAFVQQMAETGLSRRQTDELVGMRIGLLMMGVLRQPSFREATRIYNTSSVDALAGAYEGLLSTWGLELVDGVTSRDVSRTLAVQLIGLAVLAEWVDDEPPSTQVFERSTASLLKAWSRPRSAGAAPAVGPDPDGPAVAAGDAAAVPPGSETRDRLLRAGTRLYFELAVDLLRGLSAGAVAQEAGLHRQTFYRYWNAQEAYIDDLLKWLFAPGAGPRSAGPEELGLPRLPSCDLETFVRDLARYDLTRLVGDAYSRMRLGLAMSGMIDESVAPLARGYYDASITSVAAAVEGVLDRSGREPVEGESVRTLARVVQAQLIGWLMAFEGAPDDEPPVGVMLERALLPMLKARTQPLGGAPGAAVCGGAQQVDFVS